MQFVGKMLLYFWEKLACESIPKPKLQQVGQKLKRLFIGQTCSEQNLNCRTLRDSNMPPRASEAKSLTVGKDKATGQLSIKISPNILVKIETDSSISPVNVLEGNFGLTRAFNQLARAVVGIAPGCGDSLGSFRAPDHAAPGEKAAPSGRKVLWISGWGTHVLAGLNDFTLAPAGSKELATPNAMIPNAKREEIHSIRLSDQKLFLLQNLDA